MLLSLYARLRAENFTDTVVIDSEGTDVYVQAAYVSHQIRGDLLMKRKDGSVSCHAMLSDEVARVVIPLHVITGSDYTSGCYGQGKKKLLQKVIKVILRQENLLDESVRIWSYRTKSKTI